MSDHAERECEALYGSPYERIGELERELAAAREERDDWHTAADTNREAQIREWARADKAERERDELAAALEWWHGPIQEIDTHKILAAHDAAKDAEIVALKEELATMELRARSAEALTGIVNAMGQLTDAAEDPDVQDAIEADMARMDREAAEKRKAEDTALVKPLVEALEAWGRFAAECLQRNVLVPLWAAELNRRAIELTRAALAPYKCRTCDGSRTVFDDPSAPCPECTKEVAGATE